MEVASEGDDLRGVVSDNGVEQFFPIGGHGEALVARR